MATEADRERAERLYETLNAPRFPDPDAVPHWRDAITAEFAAIRKDANKRAAEMVRKLVVARENLEVPFTGLNWCSSCNKWKNDLIYWNGGTAYFKSCRHDEGDNEDGMMHELRLVADRIEQGE